MCTSSHESYLWQAYWKQSDRLADAIVGCFRRNSESHQELIIAGSRVQTQTVGILPRVTVPSRTLLQPPARNASWHKSFKKCNHSYSCQSLLGGGWVGGRRQLFALMETLIPKRDKGLSWLVQSWLTSHTGEEQKMLLGGCGGRRTMSEQGERETSETVKLSY